MTTMLTTVDNPFNPFTQYDDWYAWDVASGYNTVAFLARVATVSDDMSETDIELSISQAIDEVAYENVSGMHRKVTEDGTPVPSKLYL